MASKAVLSPIGTLCFPALFEPKSPTAGAPPRFSCILVFDEKALNTPQYQDLRKAVQAAAADKFGAQKAADASFMRSLRLPFRATAEKNYEGFEQGEVFISPWSRGDGQRPGIVDVAGQDILVPGDVFAGQLARATVTAFAYDNSGNRGVSFGLEHLQIVKADMKRIDGRRAASSAFAGADDTQLKELGIDPTAGPPGGEAGPGW